MGKHTAETESRLLVVTANEQLLDELLRITAVAGVTAEVFADPGSARVAWSAASAVVVDADLLEQVAANDLPRRTKVIVVGRDLDDADVWRQALNVGADHVVFLPDATHWLAQTLSDLTVQQAATVITVIGGSGGAGASTLAAALALRAVENQLAPVLVDADPLGGGIDLMLGAESCQGIRWQDVVDVHGRIDHESLVDAMPVERGLRFLTWSRDDAVTPGDAAVGAVLASLAKHDGPVIVDSARAFGQPTNPLARQVLHITQTAIVVVPARLRAVMAAKVLSRELGGVVDDIRFVVRRPAPGGLTVDDIARSLPSPVIGSLPHDSRRAEFEENGLPPATGGAWRRICDDILGYRTDSNAA